jgi:hypothetical protein
VARKVTAAAIVSAVYIIGSDGSHRTDAANSDSDRIHSTHGEITR